MASTKRHLVKSGKSKIEYDYEGHPDMPMEIEGLTGEVVIFMRGKNTKYNYRQGVDYRVGAAIKNNKDPSKELKTMLKLSRDSGNLTPSNIYILVSHKDHVQAIWPVIQKKYKNDVVEPEIIVYGEDGPETNLVKFKTEGIWTAVLPYEFKAEPTITRIT